MPAALQLEKLILKIKAKELPTLYDLQMLYKSTYREAYKLGQEDQRESCGCGEFKEKEDE